MECVDPGPDFDSWRTAARALLGRRVPPHDVLWESGGLFASSSLREDPPAAVVPKVPSSFLQFAESVACHRDPSRWPLLYQILWRITHGGERHLLLVESDPDIAAARLLEKSVRREIHKMHAFVRFRLIDADPTTGRERYAAWFEPEHFIVRAATPFFRKRFANMDWSIFTPKGCAHWNGTTLAFAPGIPADPIENPDALEDAWRTYYRSIFNPARLKVKAMQTEMPKRYWKNLPEAGLIDELISQSRDRVQGMYAEAPRPQKPEPSNAYLAKLRDLSAPKSCHYPPPPGQSLPDLAENACHCRACPLWENATATVFGEGPADARIMIIGEQPGDHEDAAGRPFVGPAGKLLDQALAEVGIDRSAAYLTNAVKHFKWTPRGKHRLHATPAPSEIDACRPWVLAEIARIQPSILILLGATAARSVLGKPIAVLQHRGLLEAPAIAPRVILTVHPSYLLRLPASQQKEEPYRAFLQDLHLTNIP